MIKAADNISVIRREKIKYHGRDEVIRHLDKLLEEKVCGNLKINLFKGGITTWNIDVTYKPTKNS